jgi:hypothetical protein
VVGSSPNVQVIDENRLIGRHGLARFDILP